MMHKTPTFAERQQYNRPFSSINQETGMLLLHSERKKKKSCNKNVKKNTKMLEQYIY